MRRWLAGRRFLTARSGDMVEGALTFPLVALVTLELVNLALAGFSATTVWSGRSLIAPACAAGPLRCARG